MGRRVAGAVAVAVVGSRSSSGVVGWRREAVGGMRRGGRVGCAKV